MSSIIDNNSHLDHHPSWRMTLFVMFMAQFLTGIGFSFVFPFLPFYFRQLGVETDAAVYEWMGWSSFVFGITMAVSAPVWGVVADRYGRKIMVLRSMIAGAIILGLMGFATSPWHLLILRFFQGMATGTVAASITLVSSVTPSANLGFSMGIMQTSLMLGHAAGPFFGGLLADRFGFRIPCFCATFLLLLGTLLVITGAKESFEPAHSNNREALNNMKNVVTTYGFPIILMIYFMVYVIRTMIIPVLPFYIEDVSGTADKVATLTGTFVGVQGLLSGLSAAFLGNISDRIGPSKVLIASLLFAGLSAIPMAFAHNTTELFVELSFMGLAAGGVIPAANMMVTNSVGKRKVGSAFGLTAGVTCLGIGIGPLFGGYIASVIDPSVAFMVMGLSSLLIAYVVFYITRRKDIGVTPV